MELVIFHSTKNSNQTISVKTYQPHKNTKQLDNVGVRYGVEPADQGVENGDTRRKYDRRVHGEL